MLRSLFVFALLSVVALAAPALAADGHPVPWQMNFQQAASPIMERLTHLHHGLLYLITAISIFVLILLLIVVVRFNKKANPVPAKFSHNTTIEILWTVIPVLILVAIAIPSLRLHYAINIVPSPDLTIKVIGYQWYWNYEYPDAAVKFDSNIKKDADLQPGELRLLEVDNPIVVPVEKNVRIQLTGGDVIHAWAVPALGVKQDAVPGKLNETWFKATREGNFYGQCSELCGKGHGFMPIHVKVVSQEAYDAWLTEAKTKFSARDAGSNQVAQLQ